MERVSTVPSSSAASGVGGNVAYIYDLNGSGPTGVVPATSVAAQLIGVSGTPTSNSGQQLIGHAPNVGQQGSAMALGPFVAASSPIVQVDSQQQLAASNGGQVASNGLVTGDENYCLRWNDYEKKYAETFRLLRDDEYFTDVTLAADGLTVKAHRVILSACSNYFHSLLKNMHPWQHPVLLLQDVKNADLQSLMDFIYFGQVSVTQESLNSFLRVAEKLKIKGLCDTQPPPQIPPPPNSADAMTAASPSAESQATTPTHPAGATQLRGVVAAAAAGLSQIAPMTSVNNSNNFESLLPRSPYMPENSSTTSATPVMASPISSRPNSSATAPPAHQSPRQMRSSRAPPSVETLLHYTQQAPKRAKFAISPQSILRSQLQLKDSSTGDHVEVKSEPMAILAAQEEVPSSGVNVTEFIATQENDLNLSSLGHGISPQFIFSPDPQHQQQHQQHQHTENGGNGGTATTAITAHAPATIVTIDEKGISRLETGNTVAVSTHHAVVTPLTMASGQTQVVHSLQPPSLPPPSRRTQPEEPQDLTPGPQDSPAGGPMTAATPPSSGNSSLNVSGGTPPGNHSLVVDGSPAGSSSGSVTTNNNNNSSSSSSSSTTPQTKKDRNTRKTCNYCHKDFHEMSLKRHIKDVHLRNQNTCVICPHCCKQYASQNSLYSHLNRVHGIKKDHMPDIQPAGLQASNSTASSSGSNSSIGGNGQSGGNHGEAHTPSTPGDNHHDGIMDLAHHSDSSNG